MSPSPNHTALVRSLSRLSTNLEEQTTKAPMSETSNMHSTIAQNGTSEMPLNSTNLNLLSVADRLKTYENWPVPFMNINDLAAAGFYYINKADIVKCPYCSIEIGRWEEGDDPFRDHNRSSPYCRFVLGRRASSSESSSSDPTPNGYDVCGPFSLGSQKSVNKETEAKQSAWQRLGIHAADEGPEYPNYISLESRLRSFEAWPVSMKLKPQQLSDAGLFYTGRGDQTICFQCGGGLKNWEDTDDPWVEHARHFSKCNYVLLTKGKEFVDEACGKKQEEQPMMTQEEMQALIESYKSVVPIPAVDVLPAVERNATQENCSTQTAAESADSREGADPFLCRVCYSEERDTLFLPCGHLAVCSKCGIGLKTCVVCRAPCEARVRAIIS